MLRSAILAAARNHGIERVVTNAPLSRSVVRRFVGGTDTEAAVQATRSLVEDGLTVTLDHLGEDTTDRASATAVVQAYVQLLDRLAEQGLTERLGRLTARVEVSVKLSAVGQALPADGEKIALEHAQAICNEARRVGATVTLDMEDHTTTDSTLEILRQLRLDFPETGAVLQAYLKRTEGDCRDLAHDGSRVRLCKGAYDEPASVAFTKRIDVDRSYVRCTKVLLEGDGLPDVRHPRPAAGRDHRRPCPRAGPHRSSSTRCSTASGRDEQKRLAAAGNTVRVYLPYGAQWYGYLMRRLAERPANLAFFARALALRAAEREGADDGHGRDPGRRQDRRGAAVRAAARRTHGGRHRRQREARGPGRAARAGLRRAGAAGRRRRGRGADGRSSPSSRRTSTPCSPRSPRRSPPSHLIVSVAAGITTARIERALGDAVPVVRCMPNTPALVDEAMTVVSAGSHAGEEHLDVAEALLAAVGKVARVPETQLDAVTALSGSGPAYFFFLVEAMIDAGILLGLPRALAADLIVQTAIGSAVMLRDTGEHPVQLREAVTSPGGHDDLGDPRARGARRPRRHPRRHRGGCAAQRRARRGRRRRPD